MFCASDLILPLTDHKFVSRGKSSANGMSFTVINVSEQRFDGANDLNKRTSDYPLHDEETEFDDNRCSM